MATDDVLDRFVEQNLYPERDVWDQLFDLVGWMKHGYPGVSSWLRQKAHAIRNKIRGLEEQVRRLEEERRALLASLQECANRDNGDIDELERWMDREEAEAIARAEECVRQAEAMEEARLAGLHIICDALAAK